MTLAAKEKKQLLAQSHALKAQIAIGAETPDANDIAHIRDAFRNSELIKVRVQTKDRAACAAAGDVLVAEVPCNLVARVGHVLILHRPKSDSDDE